MNIKNLGYFICVITSLIVSYLGTAFIMADIDFVNWGNVVRIIYIVACILSSFALCALTEDFFKRLHNDKIDMSE